MAKESAEEKLLKMMKKTSTPVAANPSASAPFKNKFKMSFSIGLLNTFLLLGILVCIVAIGFEVRQGWLKLHQPVVFPIEAKNDASLTDVSLPSVPSTDYYLQKINERNIFKPYVEKVVQAAPVQGLAQEMTKYKLVGIAWLDLPESATIMIEDIAKKKIFFLKKGEQLEGVTVKTIYTDRAVFSHENEETTIKL